MITLLVKVKLKARSEASRQNINYSIFVAKLRFLLFASLRSVIFGQMRLTATPLSVPRLGVLAASLLAK